MPSYKVKEKGFFGGRIYDPEGKRRVLHTDKPFPSKNKKEQHPSWLEPIKAETAEQKAAREAESEANAKKVEQDKKDIVETSFIGGGEKSAAVETL